MPIPNIKRLTELQGGPVLMGQGFGTDHADGSGCATWITHDGQAARVNTEAVSEDSPPAQSAALGVLPQPALVVDANQATLAGLLTIQGVPLTDGMLLLLVGQTDKTQNGPYIAHANDSSGNARAWTRSKLPLYSGQTFMAQQGDNAGKTYRLATTGTIVLGTTQLTFDTVSTATGAAGGGTATASVSPYTMQAGDELILVTTVPMDINLIGDQVAGRSVRIEDCTGNAAMASPIRAIPSGADTINGLGSFEVTTGWGGCELTGITGSAWKAR